MIDYPIHHAEIVESLLNGKFILRSDRLFEVIQEHEPFYKSFFEQSFRYTLKSSQDFTYLTATESNENLSRDISIFFAILCYELDKTGKNFLEELEYGFFDYPQIDDLFENSSYHELILSNNKLKDANARRNLFNEMARRNIIEKQNDDSFSVTAACKVFIDFANELAKSKTEKVPANERPDVSK
jgi:hypothetical protein